MAVLNGSYREFTLDNGLVVALQNTPTDTVSARLRVHQGSFHERDDERGLSHLLEHCLLDGGTETLSPSDVREIADLWGYYNKFTSPEMTILAAELLSEDVHDWLNVVSGAVVFPRLDGKIVEQERNRVLREIETYRGKSRYALNASFRSALYRGHPIDNDSLGNIEIVQSASVDALRALHKRGFGARNMDLVLVGGLPKGIDESVKFYFNKVTSGSDLRPNFPVLSSLDAKVFLHQPLSSAANRREAPARINLGLVGVPSMHSDTFSVQTLFYVLGGCPNSRLHTRLSSQGGLTYGISTDYSSDSSASVAITQTEVPAQQWSLAVDGIFEEMNRLRSEEIIARELKQVKKLRRFNIAQAIETNRDHINAIYELWRTGRTLADISAGYDRVTPEDILRVAKEYLPESLEHGKYVLAVQDPLKID